LRGQPSAWPALRVAALVRRKGRWLVEARSPAQ
jgi:hypothetical protein